MEIIHILRNFLHKLLTFGVIEFHHSIFLLYPLYLNTLTISLSPPMSWLHLFNIPVSTKPHFSMTFPDAGLPVKWSAQMFSKCFSLMPAILHEVPHQGLRRT